MPCRLRVGCAAMKRNKSQKTVNTELRARLEDTYDQIQIMQTKNAELQARQGRLTVMVKRNQEKQKELEELSILHDELMDQSVEKEVERRELQAQAYSDASEATIQRFKHDQEKLDAEEKMLRKELENLWRVAEMNYEIEKTLEYQIKQEELPLPEGYKGLKAYEAMHVELPENDLRELYDRLPLYVKKPKLSSEEVAKMKADKKAAADKVAFSYLKEEETKRELEKQKSKGKGDLGVGATGAAKKVNGKWVVNVTSLQGAPR
ncbi:hypothetical protein FVE85_2406 [Porphyridium purpureum]|uniref:Uncharacterized protein n=1 Tax=Porphyridium purpureum TaxID=35688 RepID=A0A5J4YXE6_PORPP|nr:hypothetical protein FVE85_2406 [Porphyridium purpureum]|eukprot:POR7486..scf209_3